MFVKHLSSLPRYLHIIGYCVFLPVLATIISVDVVMRYAFSAPLSWGLELSKYVMLVMFLMGLLYSFQSDVHIRVDIIYDRLPAKFRRFLSVLTNICIAFIFVLILSKSTEEMLFARKVDMTTPELEMRMWWFYLVVMAASACMTFYALIEAVLTATGRTSPAQSADDREE